MSAVPGHVALPEVPGPVGEHGADEKLPFRATIYFFVIAALTAAVAVPLLTHVRVSTNGWLTFAILGTAVSLGLVSTLNRFNFLAAAIALGVGAVVWFFSTKR